MKNFEMFYDFCGVFDKDLKKDYRKSKISAHGVTFPQFCVTMFANLVDDANEVFNVKKKPTKKLKTKTY